MKILWVNKTITDMCLRCNCNCIFRTSFKKDIIKCPCTDCTSNVKFLYKHYQRSKSDEAVASK